jgi:Ca2+-binding EF-hand superfamily protein
MSDQFEDKSSLKSFIISQQEQVVLAQPTEDVQINSSNQMSQDYFLKTASHSTASANTESFADRRLHDLIFNQSKSNLSQVEAAILRSTDPIDIHETEEIIVNGERGILANKSELINWHGELPLSQYAINDDQNPEIIHKQTNQNIVYHQEIAIRYLRPPTPPPPGEILIQQEESSVAPPAPPLVIRQQPPRPTTPPPLVIREAPPPPPPEVGRKIITITGKQIPPPPRKVIIERLPTLPSKPQSVIIERWLPYKQIKRKIIYVKSSNSGVVSERPKNVVIQWESPKVQVKKEFKDLGVVKANPIEYVQRYGNSLKRSIELPPFVKEIKPPSGVVLAAESSGTPTMYELEGDVHALNLIDLEREGLVEYRYLVKQLESQSSAAYSITNDEYASQEGNINSSNSSNSIENVNDNQSNTNSNNSNKQQLSEIFKSIRIDSNNTISLEDTEMLFLKLNNHLGRYFEENDLRAFLNALNLNENGRVNFSEFRSLFEQSLRS